ncbi:hypothetical protein EXIGLDRAFT_584985, partial [Exidia glandulosa HHB12029]
GEVQPSVLFHEVLHVPSLASNLLCVFSLMTKRSYTLHGKGTTLSFELGGRTRMTATVTERDIGYLDGRTVLAHGANASHAPISLERWHYRFGHRDPDVIRRMSKDGSVTGLKITGGMPSGICKPCLVGKQSRAAIPRGPARRRDEPLALVHWDLKGPLPRSLDGSFYMGLALDDHS